MPEGEIYWFSPEYFPGVSAVIEHATSLGIGRRIALHELNYKNFKKEDLLILGAWEPDLYPTRIRRINCRKAILWTSSWGQMLFSPNQVEVSQLEHILNLLKNGRIDYLFIGSKEIYEYYKNVSNVYQFPYPFNPELILRYRAREKIPNSVSLFIPPGSQARKNYLNMKIGFELAKRRNPELTLYTNETWIPKEQYCELLSKMMLNLHCTWTESFCYQVAEALFLSTLSLVSQCIADNLNLNDFSLIHNLDSPREIAEKIVKIIKLDKLDYERELALQQSGLQKLIEKNNTELVKCLKQS